MPCFTGQFNIPFKNRFKAACFYKQIFLILLFFSSNVICASIEKIKIENDTVFTASFKVSHSVLCVIEPGVEIVFDNYSSFIVEGQLIARGERDNKIVLRGSENDTVERGGYSWRGIEIRGSKSQADLRHCVFKGAYRNMVWGAEPVFDSCEFSGNHYAIYCTKKSKAKIKNCVIHKNIYGIVADFASPLLLDNFITENEIGLYIQLSSDVIAGRNIIEKNGEDIKSEGCFGENSSVLSPKYIWDFMRRLY